MALPVTEFATLPVQEGANALQAIQQSMSVVAKQPGFQRAFWGPHIESPNNFDLWIEWDSIDSHTAFINSPDFQASGSSLGPILSGAPSVFHVKFSSKLTEAIITSPALEIASFFSPTPEMADGFEKFISVLGKSDGFHGSGSGSIVEDVSPSDGGDKQKAFLGVIGWSSVDSHVKAMQGEDAVKAIPLLTNASGSFSVHHARLQQFKAGPKM